MKRLHHLAEGHVSDQHDIDVTATVFARLCDGPENERHMYPRCQWTQRLHEHVRQPRCLAQDARQFREDGRARVRAVDLLVAALLSLQQAHFGKLAEFARYRPWR
jgi:hypothetical protein